MQIRNPALCRVRTMRSGRLRLRTRRRPLRPGRRRQGEIRPGKILPGTLGGQPAFLSRLSVANGRQSFRTRGGGVSGRRRNPAGQIRNAPPGRIPPKPRGYRGRSGFIRDPVLPRRGQEREGRRIFHGRRRGRTLRRLEGGKYERRSKRTENYGVPRRRRAKRRRIRLGRRPGHDPGRRLADRDRTRGRNGERKDSGKKRSRTTRAACREYGETPPNPSSTSTTT